MPLAKIKTSPVGHGCFLFLLWIISLIHPASAAGAVEPSNIEVRLLWGTNDKVSPNPHHRSLETFLTKQLRRTLCWTNYFEVAKTNITITTGNVQTVRISKECTVKLHQSSENEFVVELYGKGKLTNRSTEKLVGEHRVVLAGDSENGSAWFVVLKNMSAPSPSKAVQR